MSTLKYPLSDGGDGLLDSIFLCGEGQNDWVR